MRNEEEERLRYLEFVRLAALHAAVSLARLYVLARESAGPLRPGVQTVEGTVRTVVRPVYERVHDVPFQLLQFVDRKVGESVQEIERRVPAVVVEAPAAVRSVVGLVQRSGVVGTATCLAHAAYARYGTAARGLYANYEPTAEQYAVSAWRSLNRLPLFPPGGQCGSPNCSPHGRAVQPRSRLLCGDGLCCVCLPPCHPHTAYCQGVCWRGSASIGSHCTVKSCCEGLLMSACCRKLCGSVTDFKFLFNNFLRRCMVAMCDITWDFGVRCSCCYTW